MRKSITLFFLLTLPFTAYPQIELQEDIQETIGHNYMHNGKYEEAVNTWKQMPLKEMKLSSIEDYALACYFLGRHADGLSISQQGLNNYPDSYKLYRNAMMCCVELGQFDNALTYADLFFSHSDSINYFDSDYYYKGRAYNGVKKYRNAIDLYDKALELRGKSRLLKNNIIESEKVQSYFMLINSFIEQADSIEDNRKMEVYQEADSLCIDLIEKYPKAREYFVFLRARCNVLIDKDSKKGLALPFYGNIIDVISSRGIKNERERTYISEAYRYMIFYYANVKRDISTAKDYGMKLYDIDPEDSMAQMILDI